MLDVRLLIGHNGRWPGELNRAAIRRLPAVPPREVLRAQRGMMLWECT